MSVRDNPIHTPLLQLGDVEAKRNGRSGKTELGRRENRLWAGVVCYEACRSELALCLTCEGLEGSHSEECRLEAGRLMSQEETSTKTKENIPNQIRDCGLVPLIRPEKLRKSLKFLGGN